MLRNHQLARNPVDVRGVVRESVALVSQEATARQIQIDVDLPSTPCFIAGDQVLLQQVLVNLTMNAMDAMAETPPDRRRVAIQKRGRGPRTSRSRCGTPERAFRTAPTATPSSHLSRRNQTASGSA